MDTFILISPLLLVMIMLILRQHMLFAALSGGVLALIVGGLPLDKASSLFLTALHNTVGVEVSIIYAAIGGLLAKAGCFNAIVDIARFFYRKRGHIISMVAVLVLLHGIVTYMIGLGANSTYLIAPMLASLIGAQRHVMVALAITSAIGFSTSPSSPETFITAQIAQRNVMEHAAAMLPYTFVFYLLAVLLAAYGIWRHHSLLGHAVERARKSPINISASWKMTLPALTFFVLLIVGNPLNKLLGANYFTPMLTLIVVCVLTALCTALNSRQVCKDLLESSRYILVALFGVGIFLGFINIMGEIGTFSAFAALESKVPRELCLPVVMLIGFLAAIPSGAFCTAIVALVLPTLASMGDMSSVSMGFVTMSIALGAHLSPVQVNVHAIKDSFNVSLKELVHGNVPFMFGLLLILMIVAVVWL